MSHFETVYITLTEQDFLSKKDIGELSRRIGPKIRKLRDKRCLTRLDVSQRIEMTPEALANWERGKCLNQLIKFGFYNMLLQEGMTIFKENKTLLQIINNEIIQLILEKRSGDCQNISESQQDNQKLDILNTEVNKESRLQQIRKMTQTSDIEVD